MSAADVRAAVLLLRAALDVLDPPASRTRTPRQTPMPRSSPALADLPSPSPEEDAATVLAAIRAAADRDGTYRRGIRALDASLSGIARYRIRAALDYLATAGPGRSPAVREIRGPRGRVDLELIASDGDLDGGSDGEPAPAPA